MHGCSLREQTNACIHHEVQTYEWMDKVRSTSAILTGAQAVELAWPLHYSVQDYRVLYADTRACWHHAAMC